MAYVRKAIEYLKKQEVMDEGIQRRLEGITKELEYLLSEIPSMGLDNAKYDEILNLLGIGGVKRKLLKHLWKRGYVNGNITTSSELVKTKDKWGPVSREKFYLYLDQLRKRGYVVTIRDHPLKVTAINPIRILKSAIPEYEREEEERKKEYERKIEKIQQIIDRLSSRYLQE